MARKVTCVCGRRFHIGSGSENVQCRDCGRWWSGSELSALGAATTVLFGGEIARAERKKGDRKASKNNSHQKKQTNRNRPSNDPVGSVIRFFFG